MITYEAIHSFPKAELHCHLDGSIRPETLQKIAKAQNMRISPDIEEVAAAMHAPKECQDLMEYLERFDYVLPYLQTELALEWAAYDVMEQAAEDGVSYIEIRYAPSQSLEKGLTIAQTIHAVAKGIVTAEKTYDIRGNLLITGMRQDQVKSIEAVFLQSIESNNEKVVGLDLAGPEEENFVEKLAPSFQQLVTIQGVPLTLHAGECGCVKNIIQSVKTGATRIGHGIALKGDMETQKQLAKEKFCIEGCPTSNIQTKQIESYADYPIREWLENGLSVCINTDNRTVSKTTLTKEYSELCQAHNLSEEEFRLLNKQAVSFSFATTQTKEELLLKMNQAVLSK